MVETAYALYLGITIGITIGITFERKCGYGRSIDICGWRYLLVNLQCSGFYGFKRSSTPVKRLQ